MRTKTISSEMKYSKAKGKLKLDIERVCGDIQNIRLNLSRDTSKR